MQCVVACDVGEGWGGLIYMINTKRAVLAVVHLLFCVGLIWFFYPNQSSQQRVIDGIPSIFIVEGRMTTTTFKLNGILFSCGFDLLTHTGICPTSFVDGSPITVTYFTSPTVFSIVLGAQEAAIPTKIETGGKLIYSRSGDDIRSSYLWSLDLPVFVLLASFLLFLRLDYFKRVVTVKSQR